MLSKQSEHIDDIDDIKKFILKDDEKMECREEKFHAIFTGNNSVLTYYPPSKKNNYEIVNCGKNNKLCLLFE